MTRQPWDQGAQRSRTTGLSSTWALRNASSDQSNQRTESAGKDSSLNLCAANGAAARAAAAQWAAHALRLGGAQVQPENGVLFADLFSAALGAGDLLLRAADQHLEALPALPAKVFVGRHDRGDSSRRRELIQSYRSRLGAERPAQGVE